MLINSTFSLISLLCLLGVVIVIIIIVFPKKTLETKETITLPQKNNTGIKKHPNSDKKSTSTPHKPPPTPKQPPIPKQFYNTGFIDEPRHKNANQCSEKQNIQLSSYYNKPTEMRPVPAMSPNYSLKETPNNCPCAQYVTPP